MLTREVPSVHHEGQMDKTTVRLEEGLSKMGVQTVINTLRDQGYHPGKGKSEAAQPDLHHEFRSRVSGHIETLGFRTKPVLAREQGYLGPQFSRRRRSSATDLRTIFRRGRPLASRKEVVGPSKVAELVLTIAGALAMRGFRDVSDQVFLNKLKDEVQWFLSELGYKLSPPSVRFCPYVVVWHEHTLWLRLCRADGLSKNATKRIVGYVRMRAAHRTGCPGYSCDLGHQTQLHMVARN